MVMPAHKVTEENKIRITALKSYGVTDEDIAALIKMSVDTMTKYYSHELKTARTFSTEQVANKLYRKAVEQDDLGAQIFWLKTQGRWRTEDNKLMTESNDELKAELKALREKLDAQNKREY